MTFRWFYATKRTRKLHYSKTKTHLKESKILNFLVQNKRLNGPVYLDIYSYSYLSRFNHIYILMQVTSSCLLNLYPFFECIKTEEKRFIKLKSNRFEYWRYYMQYTTQNRIQEVYLCLTEQNKFVLHFFILDQGTAMVHNLQYNAYVRLKLLKH